MCRFFTHGTQTESFLFAYFHHLPMVSGNLTPIPQNSATKTTVWHRKFFHSSHNFVNKMRLVPFSHIFHTDSVFLVNASFHYLPMISGSLSPIPQNSITKTTVWHKKFSHISQNLVNKMRLVPIFRIIASQRLQFGTKSFLTSLIVLSIKCHLCRFFMYFTQIQSS